MSWPALQYLRGATARAEVAEPILRARQDPNAFCEYCFTDTKRGGPLQQAWHHREWQRLVDEHGNLIMWFPIEHGKTTQAQMALLRLLGKHPERQYAYVSSKDRQAKKTLGAVKRQIEGNAKLREVYPHLRPQRSIISAKLERWGDTAIRVEGCPAGCKDDSVAAFGLDGAILGTRLHGVILDNILDKANTHTEARRRWVLEVIEDEIMGRLYEDGFLWIIDTAWYDDDALHTLAKRPGFHAVKFDAHVGEVEGEPLWPERFPWSRLDKRRGELGQTAYDRQFRNKPLSQSMAFFKRQYWDRALGRVPWRPMLPDVLPLPRLLKTGVDLAVQAGREHDLTAFVSIAPGPGEGQRQLLHLEAERLEGAAILARIVNIFRRLHAPIIADGGHAEFVVEDNGAQAYIVQLLKEPAHLQALGLTREEAAAIRVTGRTTTAKKRDPELGVMGLASEVEMGRWLLPLHPEVDALWDEARIWTPDLGHYGDRLMAWWIAASSLREVSEFRVDFV